MRFSVLGPLSLYAGDRPVMLTGTKPRLLLAVLLLSPGRTVATSRLVDGLWPESPPASAVRNLRTYVHRLRQTLDRGGDSAGRLVHDGTGYHLRVDEDELDLLRFRRLADEARRAARSDRPQAAADLFDRAVDLWGGHPLEDLTDLGTDLGATVTALREQHREMTTELIDLRLRLGQPARVIPSLRRMVAEEPLDERRQAQLVTALTREGRVAEALAAYQQARRGIIDELGVDPGPTLQGALQTALDADSAEVRPPSGRTTALGAGPVSPPGPPTSPQALPMKPPSLVGRDTTAGQLRAIAEGIADPAGADEHAGVVLVSGAPGVGKSSFSVSSGYDLADLFPDGQLFVSFDSGDEPPRGSGELIRELLVELGVPLTDVSEDIRERSAVLRCALAGRRLLLIIDDVDCAQQVRPLLPGAGRSLVLINSRQRLLDLDVGWRLTLGALDRADAVELLATIAGERRVREQPEVFGRIAAACDRLPLALRIVGSRLVTQPDVALPGFAAHLEDEENRLSELAVGDISVRGSLSVSYQALDVDARLALHALARADSFITPASAVEILRLPRQQANRMVEHLIQHNLLVPVDSCAPAERFHLPELLRLFARECVETHGRPLPA
ncbi:BTAD domain-containing putative transcriptional regulator [Micromonospora aurantiaca]|uniref:Transcriptional regulator n=1 Tax=Micromonospora aurantiaca (nom. illeg.) TaxID=47850 RepID=A0A6N3K5C4_9ACTN|nr:AfsR/SARP family transcriptional regulator [Micromonospora aurantiaca]AXH92159.1 transcriptional regulator [Micromonospora aurantiaca]MBC9003212.1 winged helix-turn-helix domain-containing protein [Micromonospora aurantiaca]